MASFRVIEGGLAASGRSRRSVLPSIPDIRRRLYKPSRRMIKLREFDVELRREPFSSLHGDEHEFAVQSRQTLCIISRGGADVACAHFLEFQPPPCCQNGDFWEALDGYSMEYARLAEVLCEAWPWIGPDVSDYGSIVELHIVGCWAQVANGAQLLDALIDCIAPKHSIIVAQASPLNPSDRTLMDLPGFERKTQRRRAALMRMCERQLGFKAFPSPEAAEDGWMWRPRADLSAIIKPPAETPIPPSEWG